MMFAEQPQLIRKTGYNPAQVQLGPAASLGHLLCLGLRTLNEAAAALLASICLTTPSTAVATSAKP